MANQAEEGAGGGDFSGACDWGGIREQVARASRFVIIIIVVLVLARRPTPSRPATSAHIELNWDATNCRSKFLLIFEGRRSGRGRKENWYRARERGSRVKRRLVAKRRGRGGGREKKESVQLGRVISVTTGRRAR